MAKRLGFKDRSGNQRFVQVTETQYDGIVRFLKEGKKINAIKSIRAFTGLGLVEAKLAAEALQRRLELIPASATMLGVTQHRGNPRSRIVGLRDTKAWGRNGQFRANRLELTEVGTDLVLNVWSVREGKHAPVSLTLCAVDGEALKVALDQLV